MSRVSPIEAIDSRKLLVERVAQSRHIGKSARLHDLLTYLCNRVIDDGVEEIHEQEVGHEVFGRPKDYLTASDNIVRVHASTLRKRLDQFFAEEGRDEPVAIELPKGNYAPVFRHRFLAEPAAAAILPGPRVVLRQPNWRLRILAALAAIFAGSTLLLLWRLQTISRPASARGSLSPGVKALWSAVFRPGEKTDIVLDDAALGLSQELLRRPIGLSEYFDRSYLRRLGEKSASPALDPEAVGSIMLKRHSSYSSASLLWRLSHIAAALGSDGVAHFARDYSFRELKSTPAILLGNSRSNPWIEPFEGRLGIRWEYDEKAGVYYPVDSWAGAADAEHYRVAGERPDGYCSIALLPNLGGTGNVLILSGTGGSAAGAGIAFLLDEESIARLRAKAPETTTGTFPNFEALLKIRSRNRLPRDTEVLICRRPRS